MTGRRLLWALLAAAACHEDATAVVLEVQPGAPRLQLDEVVFHVEGPGLGASGRDAHAAVNGPAAKPFPLTLVLLRDAGSPGPFVVSIYALKGGERAAVGVPAAGSTGAVAFQDGQTVRRAYELRASTSAPDAAPAPVALDAGAAPDAAPAPPPALVPDAASPAPPAPAPDAAPMPPPAAPAPPPPAACAAAKACMGCACATGCACTLDCGGKGCAGTCGGAGTTCRVPVADKQHADVKCDMGATCSGDARGDGELTLTCTSATCDATCAGKAKCHVACRMGSSCLLRCADDADCQLTDCMPVTCSDGSRVCNRACP